VLIEKVSGKPYDDFVAENIYNVCRHDQLGIRAGKREGRQPEQRLHEGSV
jgi:CubicO group peptidase (beta-lactamase class C family)